MAVPVIDHTQSVLGYLQNQTFQFQPYATNEPTRWLASSLPAGVFIDENTGLIHGASYYPGVYVFTLIAINSDGDSEPVKFTFGFEAAAEENSNALECQIDLVTRVVSFDGVTAGDSGPALFFKRGDNVVFLFRFVKYGTVIDLDLASLKMSVKENEPDAPILYSSNAVKSGDGLGARYKLHLHLDPETLDPVLSNYEADLGTFFTALGEIEWVENTSLELVSSFPSRLRGTSQTFTIGIMRDLVADAEPTQDHIPTIEYAASPIRPGDHLITHTGLAPYEAYYATDAGKQVGPLIPPVFAAYYYGTDIHFRWWYGLESDPFTFEIDLWTFSETASTDYYYVANWINTIATNASASFTPTLTIDGTVGSGTWQPYYLAQNGDSYIGIYTTSSFSTKLEISGTLQFASPRGGIAILPVTIKRSTLSKNPGVANVFKLYITPGTAYERIRRMPPDSGPFITGREYIHNTIGAPTELATSFAARVRALYRASIAQDRYYSPWSDFITVYPENLGITVPDSELE